MKRLLFILVSLFLITACNGDNSKTIAANEPAYKANVADYNTFKTSVKKHKVALAGHPAKIVNYLFSLINNDIYAYWKGTPWDFNGTTRTPQSGEIACGYFVTNTLADLGFKIDNNALAQCISGDMIKVLCTGIHSFNGLKDFAAYMDKQPDDSVYILGLDFHTGYVVKDATGTYFLHSNYIGRQGVIKEKIRESQALATNKFFMVGSLTANKQLLQKWVAE